MISRLIAIGDIHGCYDQFKTLMEDKLRITKSDRIILLGDYIDRGSQIKEVIDYIVDLQQLGFDIIPLMGNHESMMLNSVIDEGHLMNWYINNGRDTLSSFGVRSVRSLDDRYLQFFSTLALYHEQDKYIFVHAGFNDDLADPFEDTTSMLWSRREKYSNPAFRGKIIVHGHTPVTLDYCRELTESRGNVLNIDTGCVYDQAFGYGHLTAIELNSRELFSV